MEVIAANLSFAMPPLNCTVTDATEAPLEQDSRPKKQPRKVRPCKCQHFLSASFEPEQVIDVSSSDDEGPVRSIPPPANVHITMRYVNGWCLVQRRTLTTQELENRKPNLYKRYLQERRRCRREEADKLRQLKSQKVSKCSQELTATVEAETQINDSFVNHQADVDARRLQEPSESNEMPKPGSEEVDGTLKPTSSSFTVISDKPIDDSDVENEKAPGEEAMIVTEAEIHAISDDLVTSNKSADYRDKQVEEEKEPKEDKNKKAVVTEVQHNAIADNLVPIGDGHARVPSTLLKRLDWSSHTNVTRKLLSAVFPRKVLATHSLTGRPSPAFPDKPAKKRLDSALVSDIIRTVVKRCKVAENLVRVSITTKCADEAKMLRNRKSRQENIPPLDDDSS